MNTERPRIKVKVGLLGSSDMTRVKSRDVALEKAHKEFLHSSFFSKAQRVQLEEPSPDTMVRPWNPFKQCFDSKKIPYRVVKSAGCKWSY